MKHVFIKETMVREGKKIEGYTTLTGALKSEGLYHMYTVIRRVIIKVNMFQHGNIIFKRISLNHQKHSK